MCDDCAARAPAALASGRSLTRQIVIFTGKRKNGAVNHDGRVRYVTESIFNVVLRFHFWPLLLPGQNHPADAAAWPHEPLILRGQTDVNHALARAMSREPDNGAALALAELARRARNVVALCGRANHYFAAGRCLGVASLS